MRWLAGLLLVFSVSAGAQQTLPTYRDLSGQTRQSEGVVLLNADGSISTNTGSGAGSAYTGPAANQLPASLGAKTAANSLSLAPATDAVFPASQSGQWNIGTVGSITNPIGLAAGSNVIGGVTQSGTWTVGISGTVPVSGTFWQATQPISATSLPNPTGAPTATVQSQQLTAEQTIATNSGTGQNADQINTIAGRGFSLGTGVQTIPANNYFNVQVSNPTGSGKTAYILLREFGNGSTTVLQAVLRTNCTQIAGSTAIAAGNRMMGSANPGVLAMSYQIGTTAISTGTLGPAVMLAINGVQTDETIMRIVPPGQNFCYVVQGLTGAFAASAQVSYSVVEWEQ